MDKYIQELAEFMHNEYELYAKKVGWVTQKKCQTLFDELPPANKEVMLYIAKSVSDKLIRQNKERTIDLIENMKIEPMPEAEGTDVDDTMRTINNTLSDVINKIKNG